ncbi:MAG: mannose-6-phosphate isomerase, class I [Arcanobacterium sp.]|nr:mannose-6-phosphate isomerase, class I [Arcanobacterium sp.]
MTNEPVAEVWFGAHTSAPSFLRPDSPESMGDAVNRIDDAVAHVSLTAADLQLPNLHQYISEQPQSVLGSDVEHQFRRKLPFLLKVVAPNQPLSLQVHPSRPQALLGYSRENENGIDIDSLERSYRDPNHKPELLYVLSQFEALVGFRSPRRIMGVLRGLNTAVTNRLFEIISRQPNEIGVRAAFSHLLSSDTRPSEEEVHAVVTACAKRDPKTSPSARADSIVGRLAQVHPGDAGVLAALLLNPVTLYPGEALFIPVGTVHAYLEGLGIEVMANSDNVLRAGLTVKHIDVLELMQVVDTVAAPPIRIAPEIISPIQSTFYAPVDDFELSVIEVSEDTDWHPIRGTGPRIILVIDGEAVIRTATDERTFAKGDSVFLEAQDGVAQVRGLAKLIQADVP